MTAGIALFLSRRPAGGAEGRRVRLEESGPARISPPLNPLASHATQSVQNSGVREAAEEQPVRPAPAVIESGPLPITFPVTVNEAAINPRHVMPDSLKKRRADLLALEKALTAHALHFGSFPSGSTKEITDALIAKGILVWPKDRIGKDGHLLDGGNAPYYVETTRHGRFTIISSGPDKEFNTPDDIFFQNFESPSTDGFP